MTRNLADVTDIARVQDALAAAAQTSAQMLEKADRAERKLQEAVRATPARGIPRRPR